MFRKLLASPSRFHFEHSFSLRLTLGEFSMSVTTFSTVKEWHTVLRLLVPRDALQQNDFFQVRFV